jgi:hypothetical protein
MLCVIVITQQQHTAHTQSSVTVSHTLDTQCAAAGGSGVGLPAASLHGGPRGTRGATNFVSSLCQAFVNLPNACGLR